MLKNKHIDGQSRVTWRLTTNMQTRKKVVSHAANETHSHKTTKDRLLKLLKNNKKWASAQTAADPDYFNRLTHQQVRYYSSALEINPSSCLLQQD